MPATSQKRQSAPRGLLDRYDKIPGLAATVVPKLHELCGNRWLDLLLHLPHNLLDRRIIAQIANAPTDAAATFELKIIEHGYRPKRRRQPFKITAEDETGMVELVFFSYGSWLQRAFPVGESVIVHGQLKAGPPAQIIHPQVFGKSKSIEDVAKIIPTYPLTAGVTQYHIRTAIETALKLLDQRPPPEWLPAELLAEHNLPSFAQALTTAHNPQTQAELDPRTPARQRLGLDEVFAHQFALIRARQEAQWQPGMSHPNDAETREKFLAQFPHTLTGDQQTVLAEIDADLAASAPMRRLVQGDVGAGKTVVALAALCTAIANGRQGALLAPTGILAEQHYAQAQKLLQPLGYSVCLLTGKLTASQKLKVKQNLAAGYFDLAIGTHALLEDTVDIPELGLVVIDEQHRFGVKQRIKLNKHGKQPDLLSMTATPIPRTLALTLYGDLDVSQIREKPPGRKPIQTKAIALERLDEVANSLERILAKEEQVYWVCPLVEENEESELTSAEERYAALQQIYGERVGLLHGKMKPTEKEKILGQFRDGKLKILVSTTVIEVGVDVPQATTMVIEHAERFGLSQLHQLRGRVGRGGSQSHCVLLYKSPLSEYAEQRIAALRESDDGFYLAEQDLQLRGPGELLGTAQAGSLRFRVADLIAHQDLLPLARELAEQTLADTGSLTKQKVTALRGLLKLFHQEAGAELLKAG